MRPLRLLISLSTSVIAVILLLYLAIGTPHEETTELPRGSVHALFSFTSPGSLFPPSAIISLTDDNSTFFLARPAAFGPDLPNHGLSGPLWIGSGFGDDTLGRGGEFGCSDVPGWDDDNDGLVNAGVLTSLPDNKVAHADIQSIQESAEIAGKVVLLKRGGCGFLAKVQWAQRRGGTAVIVGDDARGGALVRMYAKGDTSNITIPSLFTSHTTAHLLSSLIPSEGSELVKDAKVGVKEGIESASQRNPSIVEDHSKRPNSSQDQSGSRHHDIAHDGAHTKEEQHGLLHTFLSVVGLANREDLVPKAGSRRLPVSGDLDWIETNGMEDDHQPIQSRPASSAPLFTDTPEDFVIGKQDWRDPGLLALQSPTRTIRKPANPTSSVFKAGGGIVPGSGEYPRTDTTGPERRSRWSAWLRPYGRSASAPSIHAKTRSVTSILSADSRKIETSPHTQVAHEGLWVTLTPTNMSTSPFFDTLLVLVVSPLVTLTVVYALLLLRSRIRRRRWRAPKSVVERLPVRTYQTISETSSSATPSASSPTTPLLQHSPPRPASATSPPQSMIAPDITATSSAIPHAAPDREEEKRESGLAAWRRRYGGRQKECVVCLEEYVDGVSQVMSLPCGHEFHADCITPWLVTRRRTCPICKGDVVRSLSQSYHDRILSPSPAGSLGPLGDVDDAQVQASETQNEPRPASQPVPISMSATADFPTLDDLENGWTRRNSRSSSTDGPPLSGAEVSSSLREMTITVSTVILRGFEAVRNTTGFQRRTTPPEDIDRDR